MVEIGELTIASAEKAKMEDFLLDFEKTRLNIFRSLNGLQRSLNNLRNSQNKKFEDANEELLDSFQVIYKNYTAQRDCGRKMKDTCQSLLKKHKHDYSVICNTDVNKEKHWQEMQLCIHNYLSHCGDFEIAEIFSKESAPKMETPNYVPKLCYLESLNDEELCNEILMYFSGRNKLNIARPDTFVLQNAIKILIIYNLKKNNIQYALRLASEAVSMCTDIDLFEWIARLTRNLILNEKDGYGISSEFCNSIDHSTKMRDDFRGLIINNGLSPLNSLVEIFLSGIHSLPQIREISERLWSKSTDSCPYLSSDELKVPLNVQGLKFARHSIYVCPVDHKLYSPNNGLVMYDCGHVIVKGLYEEMKNFTKICQFCNNTITDVRDIFFTP